MSEGIEETQFSAGSDSINEIFLKRRSVPEGFPVRVGGGMFLISMREGKTLPALIVLNSEREIMSKGFPRKS